MDTSRLEKFARAARRELMEQTAARIGFVLAEQSIARRESPEVVRELESDLERLGREQVIEQVSYTWFNRFSALRYMDANRYNRVKVVSPAEGQSQPEILAEAKMGNIDESQVPSASVRKRIEELLNGQVTSRDPQGEAYRLLLVSVCNALNEAMPFMFSRIHGYTELLAPTDLLSENSIPVRLNEVMTDEDCSDVEIIGWLYQFYIAEKKEDVFAAMKRNIKVAPENIPAATQLFTPHWIVRYLVENSLGRLWMLNNPNSHLVDRMEYYIKPDQPEEDFLKISSPEEIKVCDPACGSGHMLTYAFDLLYAMYEEAAYDPAEIPTKILTKNLYGIEIDERAGSMAAFALTMKARGRQRTFLNKKVQPNICVLRKINVSHDELVGYLNTTANDPKMFTLAEIVSQFGDVDIAGSLLRPNGKNANYWWNKLKDRSFADNMTLQTTHQAVLQALRQTEVLSSKYHVVIANPPYMGSNGMNARLSTWAKREYKDSKSDLFAMFMERGQEMVFKYGYNAMVTMQSWMFLSSYEKLRKNILEENTIICMAHMANMVMGIAFGTSATIIKCNCNSNINGKYCYVEYSDINNNTPVQFPPNNKINKKAEDFLFSISSYYFSTIPGSPIAYWIPINALNILKSSKTLNKISVLRKGMCTRDNNYFIRQWYEVDINNIGFDLITREDSIKSMRRWFPYQKGGEFRQWYGNHYCVVDWENDGYRLLNMEELGWHGGSTNHNLEYIFQEAIVWSKITSSNPHFRYSPHGFLYDDASGLCHVKKHEDINNILGMLCSKVGRYYMNIINPTLNIQPGNMASMPFLTANIGESISKILELSKFDWNSYEISWDFSKLPLLSSAFRKETLEETYKAIRAHLKDTTEEMQRLEEENNRIFIDAYGLQDELTPDVPLKEITLTCNPHYRYGGEKTEEELEKLLLADTMREFISYAVGCMFGRYSLDSPGLILANQGDEEKDYYLRLDEKCGWNLSEDLKARTQAQETASEALAELRAEAQKHCAFMPDADNVIPILEDSWFADDMAGRFQTFVRVTFGEKHLHENLHFIEEALGKSLRKYFLKDFYADHVKRYKKRPIYWLFSSAKGGFNALIYMHRYTPQTASIVLNVYLRAFKDKLSARLQTLTTQENSVTAPADKNTQATRELTKIRALLKEIDEYERELLLPLATENIRIDLDDGVRVNYPRFGAALKKIVGLEAREAD